MLILYENKNDEQHFQSSLPVRLFIRKPCFHPFSDMYFLFVFRLKTNHISHRSHCQSIWEYSLIIYINQLQNQNILEDNKTLRILNQAALSSCIVSRFRKKNRFIIIIIIIVVVVVV